MGYVQAGLTRQFDQQQPGNDLQLCAALCKWVLVSTDFPLKTFCKFAQHAAGTNIKTKKCLGKEWWCILVVDKSTDHMKPHFDFFLPQYQHQRKCFFQSAGWKSHCMTQVCQLCNTVNKIIFSILKKLIVVCSWLTLQNGIIYIYSS